MKTPLRISLEIKTTHRLSGETDPFAFVTVAKYMTLNNEEVYAFNLKATKYLTKGHYPECKRDSKAGEKYLIFKHGGDFYARKAV